MATRFLALSFTYGSSHEPRRDPKPGPAFLVAPMTLMNKAGKHHGIASCPTRSALRSSRSNDMACAPRRGRTYFRFVCSCPFAVVCMLLPRSVSASGHALARVGASSSPALAGCLYTGRVRAMWVAVCAAETLPYV